MGTQKGFTVLLKVFPNLKSPSCYSRDGDFSSILKIIVYILHFFNVVGGFMSDNEEVKKINIKQFKDLGIAVIKSKEMKYALRRIFLSLLTVFAVIRSRGDVTLYPLKILLPSIV